MKGQLPLALACALTCWIMGAQAHAVEPAGHDAIDIAPFALPGTPANEVRFEEPRAIREVHVTFKDDLPTSLGLSYLHNTWRRKRQEMLDTTLDAFQLGWKQVDDWFKPAWDKGAARVEKAGRRTAILRFEPLSRENVKFNGPDMDYRCTLGIRVDGAAPEAIKSIQVYSDSAPRRSTLRVLLDAGRPVAASEIALEGYNCQIAQVKAEAGVKIVDKARLGLLGEPTPRRFLLDVRHLVSPHPNAHDDGLITFGMGDQTFTISTDALMKQGPIWFGDGGVFVTLASDETTFDAYRKGVQGRQGPGSLDNAGGEARSRGSIATMVAQMGEQNLAGVRQGQPERQPVAMMLGCKYNRSRYRIETNGDVTMELGGYGEDQCHRFLFGLGSWHRVANYVDPAPALIYHVERRNGPLRVHQESFAAPLLKPVDAPLEAQDPTICLVRFTLTNEGVEPTTATLPIGFSTQARHDRVVYQGGERRWDPSAPLETLTVGDFPEPSGQKTGERLLLAAIDGAPVARGSITTDMTPEAVGKQLALRRVLAPGERCRVELKIARRPLASPEERAALAALDYDGLRARTARFWNDQAAPWAELKTPEPELNDFHKAHLAHQMTADHRMAGPEGFISTSVGPDAYENTSNESVMCIQELEERGLREDVRKRLDLWLKYQGTARLSGRFSDWEGCFYGSGGTESGESYVQNHGWIMWALAEHYFMTRDKEWLQGAAGKLVRGADWVARQRTLTMGSQPLSRGWERGLLPAGGLEDIDSFFYWYPSNIWSWRGMNHTAAALAAIGHPEAGRLQAEADQYKADILRSLTLARQHNPLVRLRDGRWVPHYPTHVYRRGRELGWIRETLEGSVNLLLAGILDPNGPEACWILDDFQDNLYSGGVFGYPIPDFQAMWFDWAGFSCQPNLLAGLMPYLDRDEIEVYIWMFFNAYNAAYTPSIGGVVEHPRLVLGFSNAEPFKTSDESNSIKWLRYMFVYGKGDTLHLGRALPREWLSGGKSIYLKRVHTRFGVVSVEYETAAHENRIVCKADFAEMAKPGRFLVRFRHPAKKPIQSVRVDGVEYEKYDPIKGDVDVSGKSGALMIEASYSPASATQESKGR